MKYHFGPNQFSGQVEDRDTFDKVYNREFIKESAVELVESNGIYIIPPPAPNSVWGDAMHFRLKARLEFLKKNSL